MNKIKLSVVCPVYNEEPYIENCITSILHQDYPIEMMEVLLVDGMSTDETREIIQSYMGEYPFINLLNNPHKTVPHAMNIGIKIAVGEVIIRIDAHSVYPTNYFSELVSQLFQLDADNVGGVWVTLPAKNTLIAQAIAICSSHIFGVGRSLHKIGVNSITLTDTVPYGCYKAEIFTKYGLFDTDLVRNQDDEFNGRITKHGGKIYLLPHLTINYYARESISKMMKMYFQYGLYKPMVNKKLGTPATLRQFAPPLFVLYLVLGVVVALSGGLPLMVVGSGLVLYSILSLYFSLGESIKRKNMSHSITLPIVFFLIHISYGVGYLFGIRKAFHKLYNQS